MNSVNSWCTGIYFKFFNFFVEKFIVPVAFSVNRSNPLSLVENLSPDVGMDSLFIGACNKRLNLALVISGIGIII